MYSLWRIISAKRMGSLSAKDSTTFGYDSIIIKFVSSDFDTCIVKYKYRYCVAIVWF